MNSLPELINQIAISKGNSLIYESHTLRFNTNANTSNSNVQSLLNSYLDYVILQEQSQNPSFPPSQVASQVYPYAESYANTLEANPCTDPVFFMTWGRENGDSQNCAATHLFVPMKACKIDRLKVIRKWLKITILASAYWYCMERFRNNTLK